MGDSHGFFGPDSMMWRVNREVTVLFGGARALLMHAAHPLVAAGARQTGGYRRSPWIRLIRTVQLQNLVTFGSRPEAQQAADRINKLHKVINGVDPATGRRYDALAPDLLLWVHAALEQSTLAFYELTVGPLSPAERDQYHEENKVAAELLWLARSEIPATYADLERYIEEVIAGDELMATEVSAEVAELIRTGRAVPARIRPLWALIAFAATGTLDPRLRRLHGLGWGPGRQRLLAANLAMVRAARHLLPYRYRYILPARWADLRLGEPPLLEA